MVQDHWPKWQNSRQYFTTQVHYLSCSRTFFGLCPIGAWTPNHMVRRLASPQVCWTSPWLSLFFGSNDGLCWHSLTMTSLGGEVLVFAFCFCWWSYNKPMLLHVFPCSAFCVFQSCMTDESGGRNLHSKWLYWGSWLEDPQYGFILAVTLTALLCQPTIREMIYELMSHLYQSHTQQLWFLNLGQC